MLRGCLGRGRRLCPAMEFAEVIVILVVSLLFSDGTGHHGVSARYGGAVDEWEITS